MCVLTLHGLWPQILHAVEAIDLGGWLALLPHPFLLSCVLPPRLTSMPFVYALLAAIVRC